jgi:hypothetical protein
MTSETKKTDLLLEPVDAFSSAFARYDAFITEFARSLNKKEADDIETTLVELPQV